MNKVEIVKNLELEVSLMLTDDIVNYINRHGEDTVTKKLIDKGAVSEEDVTFMESFKSGDKTPTLEEAERIRDITSRTRKALEEMSRLQ